MGGGRLRAAAVPCCRSGRASGRLDHRQRQRGRAGGQEGNKNNPDRFYQQRRSGQPRSGHQLEQAEQQPNRHRLVFRPARRKAACAAARSGSQSPGHRRAPRSQDPGLRESAQGGAGGGAGAWHQGGFPDRSNRARPSMRPSRASRSSRFARCSWAAARILHGADAIRSSHWRSNTQFPPSIRCATGRLRAD